LLAVKRSSSQKHFKKRELEKAKSTIAGEDLYLFSNDFKRVLNLPILKPEIIQNYSVIHKGINNLRREKAIAKSKLS